MGRLPPKHWLSSYTRVVQGSSDSVEDTAMFNRKMSRKWCVEGFVICLIVIPAILLLALNPRVKNTVTDVRWKPESRPPYINPILSVNMSYIDEKKHDILFYNAPDWLEEWNTNVDFRSCQFSNCRIHQDHRKMVDSAAIVYSLEHEGLSGGPAISRDERNPDQAWVFFSLESPYYIAKAQKGYRGPEWQGVFNWSWSFRTDADIFHPYGILQSRKTQPIKNYTEIFKKKTKFAAWIVSHCKTNSKREKYVNLLKKYVSVDVLGGCSKIRKDDFDSLLNNDYKFYLSFENSLCTDYVTEKYFDYSNLDIIPVVRGGANYDSFLSNISYINTAHFPTVKQLADYLTKVASSEKDYVEYLRKKDKYMFKDREFTYHNALCSLCEKLNNINIHRQVYPDIVEWLGTCKKPEDIIAK